MKSRIRQARWEMTFPGKKGLTLPEGRAIKKRAICKTLDLEAEFPTPKGGEEVGKMGNVYSSGFT